MTTKEGGRRGPEGSSRIPRVCAPAFSDQGCGADSSGLLRLAGFAESLLIRTKGGAICRLSPDLAAGAARRRSSPGRV